MGISFNADEVFEMAVEIEKQGDEFYREAAKSAADAKTRKLLLDMADMEKEHQRTFEQMRQQLSREEVLPTVFDPDNEAALYLQAIADGQGWEGKASPTAKLTGNEKIEDIFKIALKAEKDSVIFYVGLKDVVSVRAGRDKVEEIIREEMRHITCLSQELAALK